jgi:hypothetical protein
MPVEQVTHIGFKIITTVIGICSFLNTYDINHGQKVQIQLQQETNRLLATQSKQARLR